MIDHYNQTEIFNSLKPNDIQKIIFNFSDPNADLRKTSARLLAQLLQNNYKNIQIFGKMRSMGLDDGLILLNSIPQQILKDQKKLTRVFNLIKDPDLKIFQQPGYLCWYIGIQDMANITLVFRRNLPSTKAFIDPKFNIFGLYNKKHIYTPIHIKPLLFNQDRKKIQSRKTQRFSNNNSFKQQYSITDIKRDPYKQINFNKINMPLSNRDAILSQINKKIGR